MPTRATCYHPQLLFNLRGRLSAAKLRSGKPHSVDDGETACASTEPQAGTAAGIHVLLSTPLGLLADLRRGGHLARRLPYDCAALAIRGASVMRSHRGGAWAFGKGRFGTQR